MKRRYFIPTPCRTYTDDFSGKVLPGQIKTFFCPDNFNTTPVVIGGQYSNNKYNRLWIQIDKCDNAFTKGNCKTQEEVDKLLAKGVYFVYLYRDYLVDSKNAYSPVSFFQTPLIISLARTFSKEITFTYRNLLIKTDFGFLLGDIKMENSMKFESKNTEYSDNTNLALSYLNMRIDLNLSRTNLS